MPEDLTALKQELVALARAMGAIDARVASKEMLAGPPSADPEYVLPGARSVISFAIPLPTDFIPDYLGKVTRDVFKGVMYRNYLLSGAISSALTAGLQKAGYMAESLSPNGNYRPRFEGQAPGSMYPDFSHRYAAVASGIGAFGWSGNVLVKGHWSAVFLGSALTEAELPPDAPLEESLCDNCKICTQVCPLEFVQKKETQTVSLGGREYTYSARSHHQRCGLACGGFNGRSRDRKWSSWATLDYEFPEKDEELLPQFVRAFQDKNARYMLPQVGREENGQPSPWAIAAAQRQTGILYRSREDTNPTCCHCLLVCSGPIETRRSLMKLLHSSGVVIRDENGVERTIHP